MKDVYCDFDYAIVAYVDILGFSEMVKSDCENRNGAMKFFEILKTINAETKEIEECNIIQFSDSVIFTLPLSKENYLKMLRILSDYQYKLICNAIICRGAIAYGKHYMENEFMFSQGLIEAYQLEVAEAKYPRIVISPDLKEFYRDDEIDLNVVQEKDGHYFVDYFTGRDKQKVKMILQEYKDNLPQYTVRIREKYEWLFEYWEFIFKEKLTFNQQRFRIK